tara:strand:+ start:3770 stop:4660 length:891 start_codon:yes stop_codon:yes gene_type:complete
MDDVNLEAAAPVAEVSTGVTSEAPTSSEVNTEAVASSSEGVDNAGQESHVTPEVPSFPSADTFGWDSWDGKSDTLPEQIRGWNDKFSSHYEDHYTKHFEAESSEAERLRSIYQSLAAGLEDPRNTELTEQINDWEQKYNSLSEERLGLENEFNAYKQSLDQALEQEAEEYANWYQQQHSHIFENPELVTKLTTLLESGWDVDHAPTALELSDEALAVANKALTDGVPMRYALELARKTTAQPARSAPRPGARITSGATRSPVAPNQAPKDALREARSLDDMRLVAAQRAFGGKKRS